jgi:hypothetical protein
MLRRKGRKIKKSSFGRELQDLHRFYLLLFTMFIPVNPVYFKLIIVAEFRPKTLVAPNKNWQFEIFFYSFIHNHL